MTTNKILLALVALGLWVNAGVTYVRPAKAQTDQVLAEALGGIQGSLDTIAHSLGSIEAHETIALPPRCDAR